MFGVPQQMLLEPKGDYSIQIILAIIGLVGTLGAAYLARKRMSGKARENKKAKKEGRAKRSRTKGSSN